MRRLLGTPGRKRLAVNWPVVLAALPGRTRPAITIRRQNLGLRVGSPGRAWSAAEDRIIIERFSEDSRRTLLGKLTGRSWPAIYERARRMGLPAQPQGWVTLESVAQAQHMDRETVLGIVRWADRWAPLVAAVSEWAMATSTRISSERPGEGFATGSVPTRHHTTTSSGHRLRADFSDGRYRLLLEDGAFEIAAAHWFSWESLSDASRRTGISVPCIYKHVIRAGYGEGRPRQMPIRLPAAWIDDALVDVRRDRLRRAAARRSP